MYISIHQPEAFPQLSYFNKISKVDTFIFLDHVQFRKNYFQHRNKIFVKGVEKWLTLNVGQDLAPLNEKLISTHSLKKIIKTIDQSFRASEEKSKILNLMSGFLVHDTIILSKFNSKFIMLISELLCLGTKFFSSSSFKIASKKSELILDICQLVDTRVYLSGKSGPNYLDSKSFEDAGIEIKVQFFEDPELTLDGFSCPSNVSILSPLLTLGAKATSELVRGG
jgi:hypothetical protein